MFESLIVVVLFAFYCVGCLFCGSVCCRLFVVLLLPLLSAASLSLSSSLSLY